MIKCNVNTLNLLLELKANTWQNEHVGEVHGRLVSNHICFILMSQNRNIGQYSVITTF